MRRWKRLGFKDVDAGILVVGEGELVGLKRDGSEVDDFRIWKVSYSSPVFLFVAICRSNHAEKRKCNESVSILTKWITVVLLEVQNQVTFARRNCPK